MLHLYFTFAALLQSAASVLQGLQTFRKFAIKNLTFPYLVAQKHKNLYKNYERLASKTFRLFLLL